ncbi:MAG: TIGR04211 family SH3 domain-containing protein [Halofilum sp. (in: g-proteobacteria)]
MIRRAQICLLAVLCLTATSALGATRYVTDELRISLRSGAGNQYRIVRVIGTGTTLETLETEGEWARVRVGEDTGWVRNQYLTDQPVAADRLERAQTQLGQARERVDELESTLNETRQDLESTSSRAETLATENEELQSKLSDAAEGLELSEENTRLRENSNDLERRVRELDHQLTQATNREEREWFVTGAGVLFAGLISGLVVTRIPWRRRSRMFE